MVIMINWDHVIIYNRLHLLIVITPYLANRQVMNVTPPYLAPESRIFTIGLLRHLVTDIVKRLINLVESLGDDDWCFTAIFVHMVG